MAPGAPRGVTFGGGALLIALTLAATVGTPLTVGFGALGGVAVGYVAAETDLGIRPRR